MSNNYPGWRGFSALLLLMYLTLMPQIVSADGACSAAGSDCVAVGEWQFSVGVGLGVRTNPLLDGDDLPILVLPEVNYYGERFFWDTTTLGFTLLDSPHHMINLVATAGLDHMYFHDWSLGNFVIESAGSGYTISAAPLESADDEVESAPEPRDETRNPNIIDPDGPNEFFHKTTLRSDAELGNRMAAFDLRPRRLTGLAGVEYGYYRGNTSVSVQGLQEFTGYHDGQEVRFGIDQRVNLGPGELTMALGAVWQSAEVVDYFYGLNLDEVSGQPDLVYQAGDSVTPYARIDWRQPLSRRWTLQLTVHNKWFGSAITASPLVDEASSTSVFAGGVYHF